MPPTFDELGRPPLSEVALAHDLTRPGSRWREVSVVDEVGSTNAALGERAAAGLDPRLDGIVLVAELQTAGRGRLDRRWTAPSRSALTCSVLVQPSDVPVARWTWLPLLAGLAVAAAVQQIADVPARLKWPNDVVVDDRKLAGVLVERVEPARRPAAIVGFGLNVSLRRDELPTQQATSLLLEGASTTDRQHLLKGVLRRLEGLLGVWEETLGVPSADLLDAYQGACSTLGSRVRVSLPDGTLVIGDAIGIDDSGRLVVSSPDGLRTIGAGDVVHVRPEP